MTFANVIITARVHSDDRAISRTGAGRGRGMAAGEVLVPEVREVGCEARKNALGPGPFPAALGRKKGVQPPVAQKKSCWLGRPDWLTSPPPPIELV